MARVSSASGVSISTNHVLTTRGQVPEQPVVSIAREQRLTNSLTRGDLIRRRADAHGYRQPTPYSHESYVAGFVAGTMENVQGWRDAGRDVIVTTTGQLSWTGSNLGGTGDYTLLDPAPGAYVAVPISVKNMVKAKLRKRIKDEQWNAAVMIAEMGQSFDLIASSAKKLQNAMLSLVRKDWAGAAKSLGVPLKKFKDGTKPAEAWLEFHFGWAPIVADMVGAANFLQSMGNEKPRLRVAAGARLKDTGSAYNLKLMLPFGNSVVNGSTWSLNQKVRLETLTDYKLICWYELEGKWLKDLADIGFTNPASLIYNTTAFSWLTEWLIPVGEILNGLDATIGLKFLSGTETTYQKSSLKMVGDPTINAKAPRYYGDQKLISNTGEFRVRGGERTRSFRSVLVDTPFPNNIWIENPFSPWRIATSAALMRQLVPGLRSR